MNLENRQRVKVLEKYLDSHGLTFTRKHNQMVGLYNVPHSEEKGFLESVNMHVALALLQGSKRLPCRWGVSSSLDATPYNASESTVPYGDIRKMMEVRKERLIRSLRDTDILDNLDSITYTIEPGHVLTDDGDTLTGRLPAVTIIMSALFPMNVTNEQIHKYLIDINNHIESISTLEDGDIK